MTSLTKDVFDSRALQSRASTEVLKPLAEIERLFSECEGRIGSFLVQMVHDRALAEDLLQDVFHDAIRGQAALDVAENPVAWL